MSTELLDIDRRRPLFWTHVAAFGALWGSIEITVGSFVHTLRIPFAGVLLAATGVMLLVAGRQLLPVRGVTLATGVVAALCKSLSPGGVILGPMIGISTEALVVELALLLRPRSPVLAAVAGCICCLWAASLKLVMQIVLYGSDILALYLAALRQARDWLGLPAEAGWWALGLAVVVICGIGTGAALVGRLIGQESARRLGQEGLR